MFLTLSLIPILRRYACRLRIVDIPDERKVHCQPIPKVGGLAMAIGAFFPLIVWSPGNAFAFGLLLGGAIIAVFGIWDDIKNLDYHWKFAGQFLGASVLVVIGGLQITSLGTLLPEGAVLPTVVAVPLTIVTIIGFTNAINLSDGLDGLAGGILLLSFLCIGFIAFSGADFFSLLASAAMIGVIVGFLRFNTYPAIVFMGDTGSQLLGFMAIGLSLYLTQKNHALSTLTPLLLLGFPVLDTLAVMTERIIKGYSPFKPDKNHFHHKLMRVGFRHSESVFTIYVLQSLLVSTAFFCRFYSEWVILFIYAGFSAIVLSLLYMAERAGWQLPRSDLLDKVIIGRLRSLKERQVLIKAAFRMLKFGFPAVLIFSSVGFQAFPPAIYVLVVLFAAVIGGVAALRRNWLGVLLRLVLYFSIPFLLYYTQQHPQTWATGIVGRIYDGAFILLAFATVATLKFTRRKKGFKATPMDFIILFVAMVVPNFPEFQIERVNLGMLSIKIIVMMFSCEVLLGEVRSDYRQLVVPVIGSIAAVIAGGLIQI